MPRGDKTGPDGRGPMTGRGLGYCAGYEHPGYAVHPQAYGKGRGCGRGMGRGRGYFAAQPMPQAPVTIDETTLIQRRIKALKDELADLEARLANTE